MDVMRAGDPAAQLGVVHRGKIVEEQRCGVEVLDGDGQIFCAVFAHAECTGNAKRKFSANHAAGVLEGVANRPGEVGFGAMRKSEARVKCAAQAGPHRRLACG
jgi:hypothetical protein